MALNKSNATAMDRTTSTNPGRRDKRKTNPFAHSGMFGCGVDNSLLPHNEQNSAFLGFGWRREQYLTLKLRPQRVQKSGSPGLILEQL